MGYEYPIFYHQSLLTHQLMSMLTENDRYLLSAYANYRRPSLKFANKNVVSVEENTSVVNRTLIVFNDGEIRICDDADIGNLRGCDLTKTAEYTTGTPQSGLHSDYSLTNNRWYYIYAVKVAISGNEDKFVLVANENAPDSDASIVAIVSDFGSTKNWYYLGMIRYGDSNAIPSEILDFKMSGGMTLFNNRVTGDTGYYRGGILLATDTGPSAQYLEYAYSAGIGDLQIPNLVGVGIFSVGLDDSNTDYLIADQSVGATFTYHGIFGVKMIEHQASLGVKVGGGYGAGNKRDIILSGFYDRFFSPDHNKFLGRD